MSYVLTLIADPDKHQITDQIVTQACKALEGDGITVEKTVCLSENEAYDIYINKETDLSLDRIDSFVQKAEGRRKHLLIADMDSTIVTGETLDDLAEFAGLKTEIAAITQRAMNGEINFREALEERVSMLKGLSADFLEKAMDMVELTPGARDLVQTMAHNGAYCALVSGGFTFFTSRVADQVGFHFNAGNQMEIVEGTLSGKVIDPIVTKESKLHYLKTLCSEKGLTTDQAVAVGDGANDLPMIMEAGLGVAFHAKPNVVAVAKHKVRHAGLRALLFAQGYRADEIKS